MVKCTSFVFILITSHKTPKAHNEFLFIRAPSQTVELKLIPILAQMLSKKLNRSAPGKLRSGFIVTGRRCVIVECVLSAFINI